MTHASGGITHRLGIVIPVYNKIELTRRCLESLRAHTSTPAHLVIVDNASSDETPQVLEAFRGAFETAGWRYQVVRNAENIGFGRGVNQGVRLLELDRDVHYFAVVNNDTWQMPGWDAALVKGLERHALGMIGPYYDETPFEESRMLARAARFVARNRGKVRRAWVSIVMLFSREAIERVSLPTGLFDERFFLTCEDNDLRMRFKLAGVDYGQTGDCFIWHHSKGTRGLDPRNTDYERDARVKFTEKWGFDPREREARVSARWLRRWRKWKARAGLF